MINENESVITFFITGHGSEFISTEYDFNNILTIKPGLKRFLENNVTSYVAAGSAGMCSWNIGKSNNSKTFSEETYDIAKVEFDLHPNESIDEVMNTYIQPKIQELYVSGLQKIKPAYEELIQTKVTEGMDVKKAEESYKVNIYNNHYNRIIPIYEKIYQIRSYDTTNPKHEFYNFSIINYKSNKSYINYLFNNINFYNLLNANDNIKIDFLIRYYSITFITREYREEFNANLEALIIQDIPIINTYDENKREIWLKAWQWILKIEIYVFFIRLLNISPELPNIKIIYNDLKNRLERLIYTIDLKYGFYYINNDELHTYISNINFFKNIKDKLISDDKINKYGKFHFNYSELIRIFRLLGFTSIFIIDETCRVLDNSLLGKANIGYGVDIPFNPENLSKRTERLIKRSESRKIPYTRKKKSKPSHFGGKSKNNKTRKSKKSKIK